MTGRTLGNYKVLHSLGSGGMGEVYQARDLRLNRVVAIKRLRADFAANPARSRRFIQEAKAASALNHPNIITIYDMFQSDGLDCLVMEYVEGKTLSALIPRKGMPAQEAIEIAVQVADGLKKAHSAGIVHRDIKPSNIMVADGAVKILDFGLAKLADAEALPENESTRSAGPLTEEGAIMGTVSYMSPEQAQGKPVDARSDIFSFGAVLYEMLTGRQAFHEDSKVGTIAAILRSEPAPAGSPEIPRSLWRIVAGCLRKKPEDRWQDIGDVRRMLEDSAADEASALPPAAGTGRVRSVRWLALPAICVVGIIGGYAAFRMLPAGGPATKTMPATLTMLTADAGLSGYPAISRDGKLVAFASDRAGENNLDIWVKQIGGRDPIRITSDPADESDPAFSPDGAMIAFRSEKDGGGVYVVPALGGAASLLAPLGRNPRFSPDGKWVAYSVGGNEVSNPGSTGVYVVSAGGGVPRPIHPEMATAIDPIWSPDSNALLVFGRKNGNVPALQELDWWILPIDGGAPQRSGVYARLNAQRMAQTQFPHGRPVASDWIRGKTGDRILFSASTGEAANLWEISLGGSAPAQRLTLGPGVQTLARWSGDGRRMVFAAEDLEFDLWLQPLDRKTGAARGPLDRLTEQEALKLSPSASWDGNRIAYLTRQADSSSLRIRDGASGAEHTILSSDARIWSARISGDGARVVYVNAKFDLLSIPSAGGVSERLCDRCGVVTGVSNDGRRVLYEPPANEDVLLYDSDRGRTVKFAQRPSPDLILSGSRFSRDGRWVAFHALRNSTNTAQVWIAAVRPDLPVPQSEWIPITNGSNMERDPAWSADGRFLYFLSNRDGFQCIWGRALDASTRKPVGEPFAVRHFHSARLSLRHVGSEGLYTGLSAAEGVLVFAMGELRANVWLERNEQ